MKKRIAVVGGGYSGEYAISVKSTDTVVRSLDPERYAVVKVLIDKDSWTAEVGDEKVAVDRNDFSVIHDSERLYFDAVFIAVHGTPGEDGKLQGYFDMLGIPYTTGNVLNMALTFSKGTCSNVLRQLGFNTADAILLKKGDTISAEEVRERTGLPCFVKPANAGSSLGASKVAEESELQAAIEKAFAEDNEILIETYLDGTELTCGVTKIDGELMALPVTEIVTENDFFDYEAKYVGSKTQEITPARIPEDKFKHCQELSKQIYKLLNCRGFVRVDYFLVGEALYVIEVNTVPGLTEMSFFPQQAQAAGIPLAKLFGSAIEEALRSKN